MRRKSVYYYLILSLTALFFLAIAVRKPFADDKPSSGETPGYLAALNKDGKSLGPCPLVHTDVKAEISGFLARVTMRQEFHNPFVSPIEAVYTFPLPHNAAVDDMTIHVAERTIRGVIKRREEAKAIYERARAQGQLAALLDQERPNIFTQQLASILPGQNVDIVIRYTETLKYSNGGYNFVFPMVVGPRYIPGRPIGKAGGGWAPDTARVPDASLITPPVTPPGTRSGHDISIEVRIDSGIPFTNLRSGQHEVAVVRRDEHSALVQLADRAVIPNKDFILSYDVAGSQLQEGLMIHRTSGDGYFMLMLQPPRRINQDQVVPKELVFVLDTSGSMQGFPIQKAKETMTMALDGLYPHDTFNLITFSGDTRILFPQPVPATRANLEIAKQMLNGSHGSGGTEMMRAIRAALAPSDDQGHVRIVCFMTDGLVGNDMAIISEVQKHPNARVFAFGIGTSTNRFLLDTIAEEGRGAVEYVTLEGNAAAAAARFHERIRNPLLTDISLEWSGIPVSDIYPHRIPDLFSAEPIVICGRYKSGGSAALRLRGRSGTDDFQRDIQMHFPAREPQHEVLEKLWARDRINSLMAEDFAGVQKGNLRPELREAITQLGLEYQLMTQYTSFVAVEERIANENGKSKTIQVPVEMPEGLRYEGIFGIPDQPAMKGVAGGVSGGVSGGVMGGFLSSVAQAPPPPPPPVRREPIRIGGNLQESKLIRKVDPVYPELAKQAKVSGTVSLELNVDENGNVSNARVLNGHVLLNQMAIDAVKQWKYSPTLLNGTPIPVIATANVAFNFSDTSQSRIDPAIASLIARVKAGQSIGAEALIREGKAEVELLVTGRSNELTAKLQLAGFEIISWPQGSNVATGRIAPEKLEALLGVDAISHIAPHYR
jgi:Ca-activated chloride channel homolog